MTAAIVAISLVFAPSPLEPHQLEPWPQPAPEPIDLEQIVQPWLEPWWGCCDWPVPPPTTMPTTTVPLEVTTTANVPRETTRPPAWATAPSLTLSPAQLYRLLQCESGGDYGAATGNGYWGAAQWLQGTWDAVTARMGALELVGVRPDQVEPHLQDAVTLWWWAHSNPSTQWPTCSRRIGEP